MAKKEVVTGKIKKPRKKGKAKKHPNKHQSIKKYVGQGN